MENIIAPSSAVVKYIVVPLLANIAKHIVASSLANVVELAFVQSATDLAKPSQKHDSNVTL